MAETIYPSSYKCDCGHQSDFCVNTVWEMEKGSLKRRKPMLLMDSAEVDHGIEFENGRATAVICPKLGRCELD